MYNTEYEYAFGNKFIYLKLAIDYSVTRTIMATRESPEELGYIEIDSIKILSSQENDKPLYMDEYTKSEIENTIMDDEDFIERVSLDIEEYLQDRDEADLEEYYERKREDARGY